MDAIKLQVITDAVTAGAKLVVAIARAVLDKPSDIDAASAAFTQAAAKVVELGD